MRRIVNIAAGCLLACGLLSADPPACITGTLASYIALGASGCIQDGIVFANFSYFASATGGAPKIGADQITVMPLFIVPKATRFNFSAPWNVSGRQSQESVIRYTAVLPCGDTLPAQLDLTLGSARVGGIIGSATVHESTNVGTLNVFDHCTEVCQTKTSDTLQFNPVSVVLVTDHVNLVGGTGGASLDGFATSVNLCIPCV